MEIEIHTAMLPDISPTTGKCMDYLLISKSYVSHLDHNLHSKICVYLCLITFPQMPTQNYCGQFNNTHITVPRGSGFNMVFHSAAQDNTYVLDISVRVKSSKLTLFPFMPEWCKYRID